MQLFSPHFFFFFPKPLIPIKLDSDRDESLVLVSEVSRPKVHHFFSFFLFLRPIFF